MEGVEKIMLSGMTAFVTQKEGAEKMTKGDVRKAFAPKGLKVERVSKREIIQPAESYMIAVTGGT